jgi:amino acid adenylation domain-containing protein
VVTTYRVLEPKDAECRSNSVGVAFPDLSIYILDQHGEPVPIGVSGEIHVGGAGVVRGYLQRAELTAQRFVANRFSADPQARLYRTGDLGRGEREQMVAEIWQTLLHVPRVGRDDHFFELGGHSMLAVGMIKQLRERGYHLDVQSLFAQPTLSVLAHNLQQAAVLEIPPNLIPPHCVAITPAMLPLVQLEQADIDRIVASVAGGAANVQDIYPLTPLQEGMLFHGLLEHEDVYVVRTLLHVDTEAQLQRLVESLAALILRHDILRTAVLWEGLAQPVQVVLRQARLEVNEVQLDPSGRSASEQMRQRFENARVDVRRAPMQRVCVARDVTGAGWLLLLISHHLIEDQSTLQHMVAELEASFSGRMPAQTSALSFRNFVAQTQRADATAHAEFFGRMLASIDEPTLPYGLEKVTAGGRDQRRASVVLDAAVDRGLRGCARALGVSAASLLHVAWAQVLGRTSQREQVVFGTVLIGRMQGGDGIGPLINTLPIRIDVDDREVAAHVHAAHALLVELLQHEQASLVLAQRCSSVPTSRPLFSALLNYRHIPDIMVALRRAGIELLWHDEHTNYPLTLLVDDRDESFELTALVQAPVAPEEVCALMTTALTQLVAALEHAPATPLSRIDVLPDAEQRRLVAWNMPRKSFASERCIHELFEAQVERSPNAVAVEFAASELTYAELNRRANAWAHRLRALGVGPGSLVALCVQRSMNTVVSVLAVLKAGGAYVPLDPTYPAQRLQFMLEDSRPRVLMTDTASHAGLPVLDPSLALPLTIVDLDDVQQCAGQPVDNLSAKALGLSARELAYVIYTSGSTGTPKGVMVEHANITRLLAATAPWFEFRATDVWSLFHSYAFDFSVWELWGALTHGARLIVVPLETARNTAQFHRLICSRGITVLNQTPSAFRQLITAQAEDPQRHPLRYVIFGGEVLDTTTLRPWYEQSRNTTVQLVNMYGITETTVHTTYKALTRADAERGTASVGRSIPDLTIRILDTRGRPVPVGVVGEIHVGGAGVARGYLNRTELTAQRFIVDPCSAEPEARLYRSGDLGRWRADGEID